LGGCGFALRAALLGDIRVNDRLVWADLHAFLAALARLRPFHAHVPVEEQVHFPQHLVWTGFYTFPARLASVGVDRDELRSCMSVERGAVFSLMFHRRLTHLWLVRLSTWPGSAGRH
jgi:hypothetical protein